MMELGVNHPGTQPYLFCFMYYVLVLVLYASIYDVACVCAPVRVTFEGAGV